MSKKAWVVELTEKTNKEVRQELSRSTPVQIHFTNKKVIKAAEDYAKGANNNPPKK